MSAQTPYALTIPEILCGVFDHLVYDTETLFAACLVNRAWAEASLNVLWRSHYLEGMKRLASLPECRRQFYADKIRSLSLEESPIKYRHCIESLNFPRLRTLGVLLTDDNCNVNHHLVPTLEVFRLYGITPPAEDYLRQLPERCPNLREFCVGHSVNRLDFPRLGDYLEKFPKLRTINLQGMSDSAITDEAFVQLASLPLYKLRMQKFITPKMVNLACRRLNYGSLFPDVDYVDLRMECRAAAMLVPILTTLRKLKLELMPGDTNHEALQAIGTLTNLRELHLAINSWTGSSIGREGVLAIGKLHWLRSLDIFGRLAWDLDNSMTDDDLVSFFSSFPEAESIGLGVFESRFIPSSAIVALATTSTRLSFFILDATLDPGFVNSSATPLFPELKEMFYQRLYSPDVLTEGSESRAQQVAALAKIIREKYPKLEVFGGWTSRVEDDKFTCELEDDLWHILNPSGTTGPMAGTS